MVTSVFVSDYTHRAPLFSGANDRGFRIIAAHKKY